MYNTSRFARPHSPVSSAPPQAPSKGQQSGVMPSVFAWDVDELDPEDALHDPRARNNSRLDGTAWACFSGRGIVNLIALVVIYAGLVGLFLAYPLWFAFGRYKPRILTAFNTGDGPKSRHDLVPAMLRPLIDPDTPKDVYSRTGSDGKKYELVFSDEFEVEGRSFWPGDDPFWEAEDFHYWPTGDLEWYDPGQVTTKDGKLVITMLEERNHDLDFRSGMINTWNKVCFNPGSYIEASVSIAGKPSAPGLWPGVWTMGNLGRAGYGATNEGMWPYTYDTCDQGTLEFQGEQIKGLSELPGQRLSACSCPGSDHPGPSHDIGRGVPEIDILEHQIDVRYPGLGGFRGQVSQSAQIAPFNAEYQYNNDSSVTYGLDTMTSDGLRPMSHFNEYKGASLQQAVSRVTYINNDNFDGKGYAPYGFEWWSHPDSRDEGYIAWYSESVETFRITSATIGPDPISGVGQRLISEEPMYLIMNLGIAPSFQRQDYKHLSFPATMRIDHVRVYQREGLQEGVTCNPSRRPTAAYIERHKKAYTNANLTRFIDSGGAFPRNRLVDQC